VIASSLKLLLLLLAMVRAYNQTRQKQRLCQSRRSHPYLTPKPKGKKKPPSTKHNQNPCSLELAEEKHTQQQKPNY